MLTHLFPLLYVLSTALTSSAHTFPAIKRQIPDLTIEDVCISALYIICPGNQYCCPKSTDDDLLDTQCVPGEPSLCELKADSFTQTMSALDFEGAVNSAESMVSQIAAGVSSAAERITGAKTTTSTSTSTGDASGASSASEEAGSQSTTPTPIAKPGSPSSAASAQATSSSVGAAGLAARNKDILVGGVAVAMLLR
ncbi:Nn.00g040350.m01.CDS01 [Neocucurbitaria sp. VM-36]